MPDWQTLIIGIWNMALTADDSIQEKHAVRRIVLTEDIQRVLPAVREIQIRFGVWNEEQNKVIDEIQDLIHWNKDLYSRIVDGDFEADSIQALYYLYKLGLCSDDNIIFGTRFFYCELIRFLRDEINTDQTTQ